MTDGLVPALARIWHKLLSPPWINLVAPALAVALVSVAHRLWERAGRSALGRAVRWWCAAGMAALVAGGALYLLAMLPEDVGTLGASGDAGREIPGWTAVPAPLAAAGAVVTAAAALGAAWTRRASRLPPREQAHLVLEWRRARGRLARAGGSLVALAGVLAASACAAAAAGAPQIPHALAAGAPALDPAGGPESAPGGRRRSGLWAGTTAGLSRLSPSPGEPRWETVARPRAPLPSNRISAIAAGPQGEVWLGTFGGLTRYPADGDSHIWSATTSNSTLPHPRVLAAAVDRHGVAWAATAEGAAAIHPQGGGRAFTTANAPLHHQILDAVYVDPDGRVWFGGAGGVNVYQPPRSHEAAEDWPVGFTANSTAGALPDDLVFVITGDSKGRVWLGTRGGAAVFSPVSGAHGLGALDAGRWQTFTTRNAPLAHDTVHAIVEDRRGRIWLGTNGGITVLDEAVPAQSPGRWQTFAATSAGASGPARALPHPFVQALAAGPDGRIWAGTRRGLAVYDPAQPAQGWSSYHAHAVRRWTGYLWPAHWRQNVIADEITALAWVR